MGFYKKSKACPLGRLGDRKVSKNYNLCWELVPALDKFPAQTIIHLSKPSTSFQYKPPPDLRSTPNEIEGLTRTPNYGILVIER